MTIARKSVSFPWVLLLLLLLNEKLFPATEFEFVYGHKSHSEQFSWNRNWDLGCFWAGWQY